MLLAAVGDVHTPKFIDLLDFTHVDWSKVDVFILVGDLVLKGDCTQLDTLLEKIHNHYSGKIFAVFGNEDYNPQCMRRKDIEWLDNKITNFNGYSIVGSKGVLDHPTAWQRRNIKDIELRYQNTYNWLYKHVKPGSIVVTHYPPIAETSKGENPKHFPFMLGTRMKRIILDKNPLIWIHAHTHRSKVHYAIVGNTRVYNVSLPAVKRITLIETDPLRRFLK